MTNSEWYVLKAGQADEYVAVFSDERPSADVLTLEVEHDGKVDVLTDFAVVYGPCDESEAQDYLNDMRGSDVVVCFMCNGSIDLRECKWRLVEDDDAKVEYPICSHCGYEQVSDG